MTKYICFNCFHGKAIYGDVNIPYGTEGFLLDGFILMDNKVICMEHSEASHEHFAINDDGRGLQRGKLITDIKKLLAKNLEPHADNSLYQKRWDKVWDDELCNSMRQKAHADHFLWDDPFYVASIEDLTYIYNLIKEVKA